MGIERTVTLWYLHRQTLLNELASLEAQLLEESAASSSTQTEGFSTPPSSVPSSETEERYKEVQRKLCSLGPCPKPMMG